MRTRLVTVILVFATAGMLAAQSPDSPNAPSGPLSAGRAGGPGTTLAPNPRFPTAGVILGTIPTPTSTNPPTYTVGIFEADYDIVRNQVWMVDQVPSGNPNGFNVFAIDPRTRAVSASFAYTSGTCPDGRPATVGGYTGVTVFTDGSLGATDFNGDVQTLDDYLVQFDPAVSPPATLGHWSIDSATCAATCRPNGNTNVPQQRITTVLGCANTNTKVSDPQVNQRVYAAAFYNAAGSTPNPVITVIDLTPGCPGTWNQQGTFMVPGCNQPSGMDWDSGLQSLWVIDRNSAGPGNSIYEVKLNLATRTPSVVQSWPSPSGLFSIWVAGIHDPDYAAAHGGGEVWGGAPVSNTIIRYDSGHLGQGIIIPSLGGPGSGNATLALTEDAQNGGASYTAAASLASAPLPIGDDRFLSLFPDLLTLLTLNVPNAPPVYTGFQGAMSNPAPNPTRTNPPTATITLNVPPLTGTLLSIAYVSLAANSNQAVLGINGYSAPFSFTLP